MNTENKYIKIVETPHTGKTKGFDVVNKRSGFILGYIDWYGAWRQYCFTIHRNEEVIFNSGCLEYITDFLKEINIEHRKNWIQKREQP